MPYATGGSASTSADAARRRPGHGEPARDDTRELMPVASTTYSPAASICPGVIRPRASSRPATASTGDLQQGDGQRLPRRDPGEGAPHPGPVPAQLRQRAQDATHLVVHGPGRGDGPDAAQGVGDPGGHPALRVEVALVDVGDVADEGAYQGQYDGQPHQEGEAEPGVDERQRDDRAERGHQVREGPDQGRRHLPGPGGVAHQPAHQVSGREAAHGTGAQAQDVPEQGVAEPGGGTRLGQLAHEVVEYVAHHEHEDRRDAQEQPYRGVAATEHGVDRTAHEGGQHRVDACEQQRGGHHDRHPGAAPPHCPQQQPVCGASVHGRLPVGVQEGGGDALSVLAPMVFSRAAG